MVRFLLNNKTNPGSNKTCWIGKEPRRWLIVEQTWEWRRAVGIRSSLCSRSPSSGEGGGAQGEGCQPAPAACEGAGVQGRSTGSPHLPGGFFFFFTFLFF